MRGTCVSEWEGGWRGCVGWMLAILIGCVALQLRRGLTGCAHASGYNGRYTRGYRWVGVGGGVAERVLALGAPVGVCVCVGVCTHFPTHERAHSPTPPHPPTSPLTHLLAAHPPTDG